ncbi:MAG TPA: urate oxidase [Streptosporangiaceae bacterium]|nr:urate oxidase [Streptosporangiaceae bacterium]
MAIVLGQNQYGKAETRVVRIVRDSDRHEIRDLNVSTSLRGDFADAHARGDQAHVLPTDSQKNTCFAYAREKGIGEIEDYALALACHFVGDVESVREARIEVDEYRWERATVAGAGHPHTFVRAGQDVRTTAVTVREHRADEPGRADEPDEAGRADEPGRADGRDRHAWVVSGLQGLVLLKSTGSEFSGFMKDPYTTLPETTDRIMATSLTARWRYASDPADWGDCHARIRRLLIERFAVVHSLALQQTLWEMGKAVLAAQPCVAEIRLSAPNRHHFLADLAPFGLENPGEVFYAADRPYGLIQCSVVREGAPAPGPAWDLFTGFA